MKQVLLELNLNVINRNIPIQLTLVRLEMDCFCNFILNTLNFSNNCLYDFIWVEEYKCTLNPKAIEPFEDIFYALEQIQNVYEDKIGIIPHNTSGFFVDIINNSNEVMADHFKENGLLDLLQKSYKYSSDIIIKNIKE